MQPYQIYHTIINTKVHHSHRNLRQMSNCVRPEIGYNLKMTVYKISNLNKRYAGHDTLVNKDISLEIKRGEIFGLLGDNGAGKSTLVKQMVNLLRSDSGEIKLFGQAIAQNPMRVPLLVGYMPQDGLALNNLTVGESLFFTAHLRGLSRGEAHTERDRLLDLWQLSPLKNKPVAQLSGGQKRLVQIAVTMAGEPPVLILDEPTNDLAVQRRKLVWDTLRALNQKQGTTIIFITHDAIEAEKIIQRVGIMKNGELVALGKPGELKAQVDQKLRLELFFSPDAPPQLPVNLRPHILDAGRWLVYLNRDEIQATLDTIDLKHIDDFRLYSATLEDLYLHYANHS